MFNRRMIFHTAAAVSFLVTGDMRAATCGDRREIPNVGEFFRHRVEKSAFIEVGQSNRVAALERLGDNAFKRIDRLTAEGLTEGTTFTQGSQNIYLVRTQRSTEGGAISVFLDGSRVLVIHGDLGSQGCGEKIESAIILTTEANIEEAFASTSISR